jgi:hypothetical protein
MGRPIFRVDGWVSMVVSPCMVRIVKTISVDSYWRAEHAEKPDAAGVDREAISAHNQSMPIPTMYNTYHVHVQLLFLYQY